MNISYCRQFCLLIVFLLYGVLNGNSQDGPPVTFGKISTNDFKIASPLIDTNSSAVIIADVGDIKFEGNSKGWFMFVFKRRTRIKIMNKNAFDLAKVKIQLYKNDDDQERVDKLDAAAYNLEDGKVTVIKLNPKDVYEEKEDKNHLVKKFSIPAVRENTIIEYSYTIKSNFEFHLPVWEFQSVYAPTLWSEYNITIPSLLSYMSVFQRYHNFFVNKTSEGDQVYIVKRQREATSLASNYRDQRLSINATTLIHKWVMKDLPAFNIENYIFSPGNFIDKVSLQLYQTYDGESYHNVLNSWTNVSEELNKRGDFGVPLSEDNSWMEEVLSSSVKDAANILEMAKAIYYYVQDNYTCTDFYNKYLTGSLQKVVEKKSGSVGDINLLLTALLRNKNIDATPVLLSTRNFGRNSSTYPFMDKLNYVICKVKINATEYFLDGTRPFLAFGELTPDCYNGHARNVIRDTAAVYFNPDSLHESNNINVLIINSDKKESEGSYKHTMGFYESLTTKNEIAKSSVASYTKKIVGSYPETMELNKISVDSFSKKGFPVTVNFDFKLKLFGDADIVYFNPLLNEALKKNPFQAAERIYPVEMPAAPENIFNLYMEIPEGYKVDEMPKSIRIKLNENDGFFEYIVSADEHAIQMRRRLILKKAIFSSDDYATLRDFYTAVVNKESEQIVFKKIK